MITHVKEYVDRIKYHVKSLEDISLLTDHPWLNVNYQDGIRCIYVFRRKNNELLISINGEVKKGQWDYIPSMKSVVIEFNGETKLYNQGYVDGKDGSIMVLKKDGTEDWELFVNENKLKSTIEKLLEEVENRVKQLNTSDKETTVGCDCCKKTINGNYIVIRPSGTGLKYDYCSIKCRNECHPKYMKEINRRWSPPPEIQIDSFYLWFKNKEFGPYTKNELNIMVKNKKINPNTFIRNKEQKGYNKSQRVMDII